MVKRENTAKKVKKRRVKRIKKIARTRVSQNKKTPQKKKLDEDQRMVICKMHSEFRKLSALLGIMAAGYSGYNGGS